VPAEAVADGRVGAMPQDAGLVPRTTVRDLICFLRGLYRDPMPMEREVCRTRLGGHMPVSALVRSQAVSGLLPVESLVDSKAGTHNPPMPRGLRCDHRPPQDLQLTPKAIDERVDGLVPAATLTEVSNASSR
jgi:hypothetical protein